jgi:hypothetical protein
MEQPYTGRDSAHGYFPLQWFLSTLHYHLVFQKVELVLLQKRIRYEF